jgi:hypothetical protein
MPDKFSPVEFTFTVDAQIDFGALRHTGKFLLPPTAGPGGIVATRRTAVGFHTTFGMFRTD